MNNMQEMLQNSLTFKDANGRWFTFIPGTKFRAVDSLGHSWDYIFKGRDFEESPHGEDYWKIHNMVENSTFTIETEWFRQRKIGLMENPHTCLFAISEIQSAWGTDYVQFTIPEGIDEYDVHNALDEALEELEENTSLVEEDDGSEVITAKIVERAADIVCGTFRYVDVNEFEFLYNWDKWYKDHEED